jgi:predicted porin
LLQVTAPSADSNIDGQDISFSFYNPNGTGYRQDYGQKGPLAAINGGSQYDAQYSDKVTYLTPKFNGFQGGVSYSPRYETLQRATQLGGMETDNNAGDLENMVEGAVRYDGEFSGVGVHAGAGYTHAGTEADAAPGAFGSDSWKQWNAAVNLTWNAFGLGGAYITDNGALSTNADTNTYVVGGDYTYGAYVFGLNYFDSKNDLSDDKLQRYTGGVGYTFGPGMQFRGAVAYYNEDNTGGADNDAWVATVGTDIQF